MPHQAVYTHDLTKFAHGAFVDSLGDSNYDIDIRLNTIQANLTKQQVPGSLVPVDCWKKLSTNARSIWWQTIPLEERAMILGVNVTTLSLRPTSSRSHGKHSS
jgi:hypothetical protein